MILCKKMMVPGGVSRNSSGFCAHSSFSLFGTVGENVEGKLLKSHDMK